MRKILEEMSWRKICFQYSQFCVHCGGNVEPGQNGSWNAFTKEVHHEKCPNFRKISLIQSESHDEEISSSSWWAYSRVNPPNPPKLV
jgi:hypothetical protein